MEKKLQGRSKGVKLSFAMGFMENCPVSKAM
jgi:hypothetical protein